MKKYLLAAIPCIFLASCGQLNSRYLYETKRKDMPAYVTPVANVNVQKEKGQFQNTTFIGLNHFENQSSYNISKELFIQGDAYFSMGPRSGSTKAGNIGLGMYKVFAKGRLMNTSSVGYGYADASYLGVRQWSRERGPLNWGGRLTMYDTRRIETSSLLNKIYLQSNLTCFSKNDRHSFSLGVRLNLLYHSNYHYRVQTYGTEHFGQIGNPPPINDPKYSYNGLTTEDVTMAHKTSQVLDSYFTYTAKVKEHVQFFFQALLNTPLNKADRQNKYHLINDPSRPLLSTGVTFTLGPKKK